EPLASAAFLEDIESKRAARLDFFRRGEGDLDKRKRRTPAAPAGPRAVDVLSGSGHAAQLAAPRRRPASCWPRPALLLWWRRMLFCPAHPRRCGLNFLAWCNQPGPSPPAQQSGAPGVAARRRAAASSTGGPHRDDSGATRRNEAVCAKPSAAQRASFPRSSGLRRCCGTCRRAVHRRRRDRVALRRLLQADGEPVEFEADTQPLFPTSARAAYSSSSSAQQPPPYKSGSGRDAEAGHLKMSRVRNKNVTRQTVDEDQLNLNSKTQPQPQ
uniref:HP domain-containing protein n=1 Tax=Macrostomum lignano TaxID=282301 RepID=A0A1I8FMC8_9PLAT